MIRVENRKSLLHRYHHGPIFEREFRASLGGDLVKVVGVLREVTLSRADRNQDSAQNLLLGLSTSFIRDRTVAERYPKLSVIPPPVPYRELSCVTCLCVRSVGMFILYPIMLISHQSFSLLF